MLSGVNWRIALHQANVQVRTLERLVRDVKNEEATQIAGEASKIRWELEVSLVAAREALRLTQSEPHNPMYWWQYPKWWIYQWATKERFGEET